MTNLTKEKIEFKISQDVLNYGIDIIKNHQNLEKYSIPPKNLVWYYLNKKFGNKTINKNSISPIYFEISANFYKNINQ